MEKLFNYNAADEAAEFGEPMPTDTDDECGLYTEDDQSISGLGIEDNGDVNDEEEANNINELLREINSGADQEMSDEIERERKQREEYLRQEEEAYQKRLASAEEDFNRKRYEAEQKAKAERLKREEEERLREEEEERIAKENTFFGKLSKAFKKKPKKQDIDEAIEQAKQPEAAEVPAAQKEEPTAEEVQTSAVEEQIEVLQEFEPVEEVETSEPSFDFDLGADAIEGTQEDTDEVEAFADMSAEKEDEAAGTAAEEKTEEQKIPEEKPDVTEKAEEVKPAKEKPATEEKKAEICRVLKAEKKSILSLFTKPQKAKPAKPAKAAPVVEAEVQEPDWKYIALHDDATGLLNSRAYHDVIKTCGNQVAVVFFDINNLKFVNDNYSHQDGDLLIKNCSALIQKHFGTDNAYRIGGDEFVVILKKQKRGTQDMIAEKASLIHKDLQDLFKKNEKHIPHAMSIGFAIGDGKVSTDDIIKAADASMYRNKKAYKQAHPELNTRVEEEKKTEEKKEKPQRDHDEMLSKEQQELKAKIQRKHSQANPASTKDIMRQIQRRASEVRAILIADPNFNSLFVITRIDEFFNLVSKGDGMIDYSYLYVVWEGGSQYFGSDEYFDQVTELFKEIADGLVSGKFRSEKDIRSIKGINIFRQVFV